MEPTTEIVRADVKGAKSDMEAFMVAKKELLDEDDTVRIGQKSYIKRSGFRKIALAFHISTEVITVERTKTEEGWLVTVKAKASNFEGRSAEDVAACETSELKGMEKTLHNVESKAATRAINRAIADLVGGGCVSAEELEPSTDEQQAAKPAPMNQTNAPKTSLSRLDKLHEMLSASIEAGDLELRKFEGDYLVVLKRHFDDPEFDALRNALVPFQAQFVTWKDAGIIGGAFFKVKAEAK